MSTAEPAVGMPSGDGERLRPSRADDRRPATDIAQLTSSILVDGVNADVFLSSYLHSCSPPIIHGNLTCDTIFIQHNGLVKIGSGNVNLNTVLFSVSRCKA